MANPAAAPPDFDPDAAAAPGVTDPAVQRVVAARLDALNARLGDRLRGEDAAAVRRNLARDLAHAEQLRRVPLANADEPDPVFAPFRGGDPS